MSYDVRHETGFKVIGIATRTSNDSAHEIGALWKRFYEAGVAEQIPARFDEDVYSVYFGYESDFKGPFTVLVGCAVPDDAAVPEGLSHQVVQAARYAVFEVVGKLPESIASAWATIWKVPLDRLYGTDFERYAKDGAATVHVGIR
jgi:predicted transcriptional regulator YdeE